MNTETATDAAVPDFTAEWRQIREDLDGEAACALRIGQNLIKIRDALKPRGLWLDALREHGMSQPQASRYIRYAELPEADREVWQRVKGFSLTDAIGERRAKNSPATSADYSPTNSPEIPADELADRLAEINKRFRLAIEMINAGEAALAGEPETEYAEDAERWKCKLREVADAALAVLKLHLNEELRQQLRPEKPCR